jgi:hypothetical protein
VHNKCTSKEPRLCVRQSQDPPFLFLSSDLLPRALHPHVVHGSHVERFSLQYWNGQRGRVQLEGPMARLGGGGEPLASEQLSWRELSEAGPATYFVKTCSVK